MLAWPLDRFTNEAVSVTRYLQPRESVFMRLGRVGKIRSKLVWCPVLKPALYRWQLKARSASPRVCFGRGATRFFVDNHGTFILRASSTVMERVPSART